ncbi:hypothetical protein [Streptomyces sp. AK02-01A]|uniref:hypothetical protein n=1 Tax=Streptomyces sp. AK02-01A TaxID=3028648 RepID=UPI0029A2063F|nr:hypothetical protein [Streptomyces sp. AK02-01A]MDX3854156.1 hypothetical protein [Streptomyces sp. AK02-01A]
MLDTARGRNFVKGMRRDHAEAWTQQREAAINSYVVPLGPKVLWRTAVGGWDLLGFEHLVGRSAGYSSGSADLPLVVEAMTALGCLGCPDVELEDAEKRWGAHLDDPADADLFAGLRSCTPTGSYSVNAASEGWPDLFCPNCCNEISFYFLLPTKRYDI